MDALTAAQHKAAETLYRQQQQAGASPGAGSRAAVGPRPRTGGSAAGRRCHRRRSRGRGEEVAHRHLAETGRVDMDLYIVLGVEREASDAEIKRAYRRLARRFHPDINPGDREAATRFRQILDAYETLIDPDRRRRYDTGRRSPVADERSAFGFAGFDFSAAATGDRGDDVWRSVRRGVRARAIATGREPNAAPTSTSKRASRSRRRGAAWSGPATLTRQDTCRACAGSGFHRTVESRCLVVRRIRVVRSVRGHMVFSKNCPHCGGTGRLRQLCATPARARASSGGWNRSHVSIPAGVADGARVRVAGKGHAGVRGGPPGDLLDRRRGAAAPRCFNATATTCTSSCRSRFTKRRSARASRCRRRTGRAPARAAGHAVGPAVSLARARRAVARTGARGDLVVEVRLMLPKLLDERSKELLREFGAHQRRDAGSRE